jgi:hypothetical protein
MRWHHNNVDLFVVVSFFQPSSFSAFFSMDRVLFFQYGDALAAFSLIVSALCAPRNTFKKQSINTQVAEIYTVLRGAGEMRRGGGAS